MRHNHISSTEGLEKLYALVQLDLSENNIITIDHILRLKNLPFLQIIDFTDNPITFTNNYRLKVLQNFYPRKVSFIFIFILYKFLDKFRWFKCK